MVTYRGITIKELFGDILSKSRALNFEEMCRNPDGASLMSKDTFLSSEDVYWNPEHHGEYGLKFEKYNGQFYDEEEDDIAAEEEKGSWQGRLLEGFLGFPRDSSHESTT